MSARLKPGRARFDSVVAHQDDLTERPGRRLQSVEAGFDSRGHLATWQLDSEIFRGWKRPHWPMVPVGRDSCLISSWALVRFQLGQLRDGVEATRWAHNPQPWVRFPVPLPEWRGDGAPPGLEPGDSWFDSNHSDFGRSAIGEASRLLTERRVTDSGFDSPAFRSPAGCDVSASPGHSPRLACQSSS